MNLHQSEGIVGVMERAGYLRVDRLEEADVVLFNGCMVRQKAEDKVYGRIGAVVEQKRSRRILLGVGGCLGEIRGESLLQRFPAIDLVFGARGHEALPELVAQAESERTINLEERLTIDEVPLHRANGITAMVTITEGCSNFCSYCVVPYARGRMRSRAPRAILAEVERAVRNGYKEVLLLGQNVNSYGTDDRSIPGFAQLLGAVAATGIERIRFTSSHPRDMRPEVAEAMAEHANICHHIHMACQSGSDRILREMNRGYTAKEFLSTVSMLRSIVEGINVTTDLIVGYPGETEEDFERSMDLIETARFGSIFAAKYSPRPRTRSALEPDSVPGHIKDERLQRVLQRQREIALEENERLIGRAVDVLVEGKTRTAAWYGRSDDHRTVLIDGDAAVGELVPVRITGASSSALAGAALVPEGAGKKP